MKSLGSGSFMKSSQVNKNYIGHGKSCFLLKSGTVAQEYREDTGEIFRQSFTQKEAQYTFHA